MEPARLWRCLVAYGIDASAATEICASGPQTLTTALSAVASRQPASTESQPALLIDLANPTENPEFQELVQILTSLPEASRRAVVAYMVGGVPIEDLIAQANADDLDLADGVRRLEHAVPDCSLNEVFTSVFDLPVPDLRPTKRPNGTNWMALAALAAAGVVSIVVLASATQEQRAQPVREMASTTVSTTTSTTANHFVEPDREIEISITDEDTLIRREPWTRKVIWESRPFAEVEILSIDPNTVTIMTRGYRLFVSLTDGTLLPP